MNLAVREKSTFVDEKCLKINELLALIPVIKISENLSKLYNTSFSSAHILREFTQTTAHAQHFSQQIWETFSRVLDVGWIRAKYVQASTRHNEIARMVNSYLEFGLFDFGIFVCFSLKFWSFRGVFYMPDML